MSDKLEGNSNLATTVAIDAGLKARSTLKTAEKVTADVSKKAAMLNAGKAAGAKAVTSKLGAVGLAAVTAVDGYDVYKNLQEDNEYATREAKEGTARLVGNVAVGAGSLWAGAAAGAMVGTLGIPIPFVGTAVGFIAGGATAYFGSQAVSAAVEGSSVYITGKTDEEAKMESDKNSYMEQWGGKDHKSGWHGAFQQNMEDTLKSQQELEDLKAASEYNAKIEDYKKRAPKDPEYYNNLIKQEEQRVKEELALKEKDVSENTANLMNTYGGYKDFLRGAAERGYITHDKFDESIGHLTNGFKDFAHKSAAISRNPVLAEQVNMTEIDINKALASQAKGDGEVSKSEIEMLQKIMRESGHQAGEYGVNKDGVDGIRGTVTNDMLDKAGNGDGVVGYDDVEKLIKNANITQNAAGDYLVGENKVKLNKVEFEGMLSDLSIQLNGRTAPEVAPEVAPETQTQTQGQETAAVAVSTGVASIAVFDEDRSPVKPENEKFKVEYQKNMQEHQQRIDQLQAQTLENADKLPRSFGIAKAIEAKYNNPELTESYDQLIAKYEAEYLAVDADARIIKNNEMDEIFKDGNYRNNSTLGLIREGQSPLSRTMAVEDKLESARADMFAEKEFFYNDYYKADKFTANRQKEKYHEQYLRGEEKVKAQQLFAQQGQQITDDAVACVGNVSTNCDGIDIVTGPIVQEVAQQDNMRVASNVCPDIIKIEGVENLKNSMPTYAGKETKDILLDCVANSFVREKSADVHEKC